MTWSWSHTDEAYSNAYANVQALDSLTLQAVYAEWRATKFDESGRAELDSGQYDEWLQAARSIPDDMLANEIWQMASERATCDNGGFNAWICPEGCHTVSFDRG